MTWLANYMDKHIDMNIINPSTTIRTDGEETKGQKDGVDINQDMLAAVIPDINSLIVKHRLLRLTEGAKFYKYTQKGQKIKDKFWLCRLSPNHKFLYYGDYDDSKDQRLEDLPNRIGVSDFKRLLTRRECPFMKDYHSKRAIVDQAFSLVYETDYERHLDFVAIDNKTFCHWIDGLNALLKLDMNSDEAKKDFEVLSKIEIKMRSL